MTRIIILAALLAGAPSIVVAQSSTATSGTTKPMQTAPTSGSQSQKAVIPPAARSGEKGLKVGEGAVTGDNPVEIKRIK